MIIAAHGVPYVATASVAYLKDLQKKVKKGMGYHGPRYIQIDTTCPSVWGFASDQTLEVARLGVASGLVPLFEMEAGGNSPLHNNNWEHEVFILDGEGIVIGGREEKKFKVGDAILIPANEKHQLKNNNKNSVKFLCLIPYKKE